MEITYDPLKDETNQAKHGCSLSLAKSFEWDDAAGFEDDRQDYGELRFVAIGYIDDRLYVVVFTDRPDGRRIISLRKANKREVKVYAEA